MRPKRSCTPYHSQNRLQEVMLQIALLGPFKATWHNKEIEQFPSTKVRALLAYLAYDRRTYTRSELATLLWPDSSEQNARNNIRVTLHRLKKVFDQCQPDLGNQLIEADRKHVALVGDVQCDVGPFLAATGEHQPTVQLHELVRAYRGEFLAGFPANVSETFDTWLQALRQQTQVQMMRLFDMLLPQQLAAGEFDYVVASAERQLSFEPWHERAYLHLMLAQVQLGQSPLALRTYERCKATLQDELGIAPSAEISDLASALRDGTEQSKTVVPPPAINAPERPQHNLPAALTSFVAREREIESLKHQFLENKNRWVTLVGLGGIGKSRLASEVGRQLVDKFPSGVWFVPLAGIAPDTSNLAEAVATTIAQQIGQQLQDERPALEQVIAALYSAEMLLVLDNWEHIHAGADVVQTLLQQTQRLVVLCTSRIPLGYRAETVMMLDGVSIRDGAAETLFLERARQRSPRFLADADDLRTIEAICTYVGGSPLAIELAASGVRRRSLQQIVQQLRSSLDALRTAHRDIPERQNSMRAILNDSWQRFSTTIRSQIVKLAVFEGRFSEEAMIAVTGNNDVVLDHLLDASWLQTDASYRFWFHPIVLQYLREQASEQTALQQTYASYYLGKLAGQADVLTGTHPQGAVQAIQLDADNINAAWRLALKHRQFDEIQHSVHALVSYYLLQGGFGIGRGMLMDALKVTDGLNELQSWLWVYHAYLYIFAPTAVEDGKRALALAQSDHARNFALYIYGRALRQQHLDADASVPLFEALELARKRNDTRLVGLVQLIRGQLLRSRGELDDANMCYRDAASCFTTCGDQRMMALCMRSQGILASEMGDVMAELDLYTRSKEMLVDLGDRTGVANTTANLGIWHSERSDHVSASGYFREALAIFQKQRRNFGIFWMGEELAITDCLLGDYISAENRYDQLRSDLDQLDNNVQKSDIFNGLSEVCRHTGRYETALQHMRHSLAFRTDVGVENIYYAYLDLTRLHNDMGDYQSALEVVESAMSSSPRVDVVSADLLHETGRSYLGLGHIERAKNEFAQALTKHIQLDTVIQTVEDRMGLLQCHLALGETPDEQLVEAALEGIAAFPGLHGAARPFWSYSVLLDYLTACGDPRAMHLREAAAKAFASQLELLTDFSIQDSFLHNVAWNRRLAQLLNEPASISA